jgi:hypothetical protein
MYGAGRAEGFDGLAVGLGWIGSGNCRIDWRVTCSLARATE